MGGRTLADGKVAMEAGMADEQPGRHPAVSIVVPVYNAARYLPGLVEACRAQEYPNLRGVILVDDGSTDGSRGVAKGLDCTLIEQSNGGPAAARNTGWRNACGEIICFTDSDCLPPADWVENLVAEYCSGEVAGAGGTYGIANPEYWLARCIHEEIIERHAAMSSRVNYLGSFNLSYRKRVLEEVGGFDESFLRASGEDNDLAYRIVKCGYQLAFTRAARVMHHHPHRLLQYLRQQFRHGYWRMKLYRRHPDMSRGDSYAGILDFMQPVMALLALPLVALSFYRPIAYAAAAVVAAEFALQLPMAVRIALRTRRPGYLAFAPVTFLRAYARGAGLVYGVWRFFILHKR